jgi:hypothetical protein
MTKLEKYNLLFYLYRMNYCKLANKEHPTIRKNELRRNFPGKKNANESHASEKIFQLIYSSGHKIIFY